jgi:hypothetical protein
MTAPARATYLLVSDFELLEEWCQKARVLFWRPEGGSLGIFLVGSALTRCDYRDVDLRVLLSDEMFDREFSNPVKVRYMNRALSMWGQRETGLPIDFQVQRMTEANEQYDGRRNAMGIRDWSKIATSGTPWPET